MKTDVIFTLTETFEAHTQLIEGGVEYWFARDLQHMLGYTVSDHFADVGKMVAMPKGVATK